MTLEQQTNPGSPAAAVRPRPGRRAEGLHLAADRYSRRVSLLKRVLPVLGAALLLLVAAWPRLGPLIDTVRLVQPAIDLREARELKMLDPRYAGIDRQNRPYLVTAAVGRQVSNRSDLMSLEGPRAVMIVHGGAKVVLSAATGIYQSQTKLLDLFNDVTLTHQNGTRFVTGRAHADLSDNTAEGHEPIAGHGPSGDVWGQGFRILDNGDTIIFTGRSHLVLKGTKPSTAAPAPAALPSAVAKTAAQIAAAATPAPAAAPGERRAAAGPHPAVKRHQSATPHPAARPHPRGRGAASRPSAKSHAAKRPIEGRPAKSRVERRPARRKVERNDG